MEKKKKKIVGGVLATVAALSSIITFKKLRDKKNKNKVNDK